MQRPPYSEDPGTVKRCNPELIRLFLRIKALPIRDDFHYLSFSD